MHTTTTRDPDATVLRFLSHACMTVCRALQYSPVMALFMPPHELHLHGRSRQRSS